MHICKNCGTKFKYTEIQTSLLLGKQQLYCRECGAHHDAKMIFRIVFSVLVLLPIIFSSYIQSITSSVSSAMMLYISYLVVIILIIPYLIRYRLISPKTQ